MSEDIVPTNDRNGTISRRRIADATGIARATVSRSLRRLIDRGMVVERGRGKLQVPVGIVLQGDFAIDPTTLYAPIACLFEQFLRLGVVRVALPDANALSEIISTSAARENM